MRATIIAAIITSPRHRLAILIVARFPSRLSRYSRVDIQVGAGRRRRWSDAVKGRIVAESYAPGAVASEVARRHGLARNISSFGARPRVPEC
ncbi:transposase [Bradyrhizobium sp. 131]|nr:transposase [Bradyrhizobium sp. 131]